MTDRILPPTDITEIEAASGPTSLGGISNQWVSFYAMGDLTIKFGPSDMTAATSNDWPMAEGETQRWYIGDQTNYVSTAGAGDLRWAKS